MFMKILLWILYLILILLPLRCFQRVRKYSSRAKRNAKITLGVQALGLVIFLYAVSTMGTFSTEVSGPEGLGAAMFVVAYVLAYLLFAAIVTLIHIIGTWKETIRDIKETLGSNRPVV